MSDTVAIQETWRYIWLTMIPLIVFGVALIVVALIGLRMQLKKAAVIGLLLLGSFVSLYAVAEILLFQYDLQEEAFDTYYGEFDYMDVSGNKKDPLDITENTRLYVRSVANWDISSGTYEGYIRYGKHSRWVVEVSTLPTS